MPRPEESPEKQWARAKRQCANCPLLGDVETSKTICEHPHRVTVQRLVDRGKSLGPCVLGQFWEIGLFVREPKESRAAVELLAERPDPDPKFNVIKVN